VRIVLQTAHSGSVYPIAFSPGGRFVLSGSDDGTIKLWDVASGREIRTWTFFTGDSDSVRAVELSPDGRTLLTMRQESYEYTIKLWDVASGQELKTFTVPSDEGISVALSPDGSVAFFGSEDGTIKLWDIASGYQIRTFKGDSDEVTSFEFSPDGRTALSGSYDGTIKLWDVASGRELKTLSRHSDVRSVAFSPDSALRCREAALERSSFGILRADRRSGLSRRILALFSQLRFRWMVKRQCREAATTRSRFGTSLMGESSGPSRTRIGPRLRFRRMAALR